MSNNVISVKKNDKPTTGKPKHAPLFRTVNYILMIVGIVLLVVGYILLRGGAVEDPSTFDGEIFNTRRMVVSPIFMLLGLVIEIVAIMWHPRQKKNPETTTKEE